MTKRKSANSAVNPDPGGAKHDVRHRTLTIDGLQIFYREAGPADAATLVLLHGFPSASH